MNAERTLSTPIAADLRRRPAERFPYSIAYDSGVLEAIRRDASRISPRAANDGRATWGLLWGTHGGSRVEILACSPLAPHPPARSRDHTPVTGLVPSLRRALSGSRGKPGLVPLGFYRVQDGGEISFSQDEARALAELFPEPWQFVMVLYSAIEGLTKVRLFFRLSDGLIGTDSTVYELSPDGSEAVMDARAAAPSDDYPGEIGTSSGLVKFRRPARSPRAPGRSHLWPRLVWSIAGIAVAVAAIEFRVWNFYNPGLMATASEQRAGGNDNPSEKVAFQLQARITESKPGPVIRLQWDPLASAIRNSPVAVLSVSDGDLSRQFVFKRRELDLGYTDYPAASDEVTFRLIVEEAGGPKQESLLVLLGGPNAESTESELSLHPPGEISRSDVSAPSPTFANHQPQQPAHRTESAKRVDIARTATGNSARSSEGAPQSGQRSSITQMIPGVEPILNPGAVPEIPQQVSPSPPSTVGQLGIQRIPNAPPPPASSNAAQPKPDFVAPSVVQRVPLVLPYSVRRLEIDDLRIKVRVEVDSNGKVTSCRPLSPLSGVNKYLANVARETVMQWRFSPGRLGGKPVASETVLDLDFSDEH